MVLSIGDPSHSQQAEQAVQRKSQTLHEICSAHMLLCTNKVGKQTCRLVLHPQIQAPTWQTAFESGSDGSHSASQTINAKLMFFNILHVLKAIPCKVSECPQYGAPQEKRKRLENLWNFTIRRILVRLSAVMLILQNKKADYVKTDDSFSG